MSHVTSVIRSIFSTLIYLVLIPIKNWKIYIYLLTPRQWLFGLFVFLLVSCEFFYLNFFYINFLSYIYNLSPLTSFISQNSLKKRRRYKIFPILLLSFNAQNLLNNIINNAYGEWFSFFFWERVSTYGIRSW